MFSVADEMMGHKDAAAASAGPEHVAPQTAQRDAGPGAGYSAMAQRATAASAAAPDRDSYFGLGAPSGKGDCAACEAGLPCTGCG